jgi:hypothetical protein
VRGVGGDFKGVAGISVSVDDRELASALGRGNVMVRNIGGLLGLAASGAADALSV